jgi:hypothetical protein
VKNFGRLEKASHKRILVATHIKLIRDDQGKYVDQSLYKSMIGSLLYLTVSHPDITYFVGVLLVIKQTPRLVISSQVH